jgi:hypothetical protein
MLSDDAKNRLTALSGESTPDGAFIKWLLGIQMETPTSIGAIDPQSIAMLGFALNGNRSSSVIEPFCAELTNLFDRAVVPQFGGPSFYFLPCEFLGATNVCERLRDKCPELAELFKQKVLSQEMQGHYLSDEAPPRNTACYLMALALMKAPADHLRAAMNKLLPKENGSIWFAATMIKCPNLGELAPAGFQEHIRDAIQHVCIAPLKEDDLPAVAVVLKNVIDLSLQIDSAARLDKLLKTNLRLTRLSILQLEAIIFVSYLFARAVFAYPSFTLAAFLILPFIAIAPLKWIVGWKRTGQLMTCILAVYAMVGLYFQLLPMK